MFTDRRLKKGSIPNRNLPIGSHDHVIKNRVTLNSNKNSVCSKQLLIKTPSEPSNVKNYIRERATANAHQASLVENDIRERGNEQETLLNETTFNELNDINAASFIADVLQNIEMDDGQGHNKEHSVTYEDKETQTTKHHIFDEPLISYDKLSGSELLHFTGLTSNRFEFLFARAKQYKSSIKCCLLKDQLLITLMKYKKNYEYVDLAIFFRINRHTISRIVYLWTDILYISFKKVDFWNMRYTRNDLYTAMLDCTEIPIEKPKDPNMQQVTWSNYKNTNTFKSLIGNDEAGSIIYISDLFVGGISDREIVKKSGILDKLQPGDSVLADRGFVISDLLEEKNVLLNLPPFLRNKSQFSEDEVRKTRRIASRRITVENVIGQAKKSKILSDRCKSHLWPIMNKIHYNCFSIANIRNPVVNIPSRDDT